MTEEKRRRLDAISNDSGVIAALAMDQRKSLRVMLAAARDVAPDAVPDSDLECFKAAVTKVLSPHASAVLLDPEYALRAMPLRADRCGLLVTYEADGFENPRPHRMLALLPHISVRRIRDTGASGVKILLSWAPDGDEAANDEKRALIERIGHECAALGMPFLLEPVVYDPAGTDPKSPEFAKGKPQLVVRTMAEFSNPAYCVDVLKVEFPVGASFVEGTSVTRQAVWTKRDALEWYRAAGAATKLPFVYLSAGVTAAEFTESLRLAAEAGTPFSGVLCGRATWQGGVAEYVNGGVQALAAWLAREGVRNLQSIDHCLEAATPWRERLA